MTRRQKRSKLAVAATFAVVLATLSHPPLAAQNESDVVFKPDRHLPEQTLLHLHIPSVRALGEALASTLPGRVASDPDVRAAFADVAQKALVVANAQLGPIGEAIGVDPLAVLKAIEGELVVSVTGLDPISYVSVVVAVELGDEAASALRLVDGLAGLLAGGEPRKQDIAGRAAAVLPLEGAPPAYAFTLGRHLVLGLSKDVLAGICAAYDADAGGAATGAGPRLADNANVKALAERTAVASPRLRLAVNVQGLRALAMMPLMGNPDGQRIIHLLNATGVASLDWLGYSLGVAGGDVEGKLSVLSPKERRGALGALLDSAFRPSDVDEFIARVPANASGAGFSGGSPGAMLAAVYGAIDAALPAEAKPIVAGIVQATEAKTGLSLEDDVFTIGPFGSYTFLVPPPGGGLFDDQLSLVKTAEIGPWLAVLEKFTTGFGHPVTTLQEGDVAIRTYRVTGLMSAVSELLGAPSQQLPFESGFMISMAKVDDEWTVMANATQPIVRYLRYYREGPKLAADAPLARALAELDDAKWGGVFAPSRLFLQGYRFFVEALPSRLVIDAAPIPFEIDATLLPPPERFLEALRPASFALSWDDEGIDIAGRGVFSAVSGYVVLGGAIGGAVGVFAGSTSAVEEIRLDDE